MTSPIIGPLSGNARLAATCSTRLHRCSRRGRSRWSAPPSAGSLGRTVFENLLAAITRDASMRSIRTGASCSDAALRLDRGDRRAGRPRGHRDARPRSSPTSSTTQAARSRAAVLLVVRRRRAAAAARSGSATSLAAARAQRIRLLGPGAFGVIRTEIGLNATFCAPIALPGRLALVAQSGAVCTAMLDFAAPLRHRLFDRGLARRRHRRRLRRIARCAGRRSRAPTASCCTSKRSATRARSCPRCARPRAPSPSSC